MNSKHSTQDSQSSHGLEDLSPQLIYAIVTFLPPRAAARFALTSRHNLRIVKAYARRESRDFYLGCALDRVYAFSCGPHCGVQFDWAVPNPRDFDLRETIRMLYPRGYAMMREIIDKSLMLVTLGDVKSDIIDSDAKRQLDEQIFTDTERKVFDGKLEVNHGMPWDEHPEALIVTIISSARSDSREIRKKLYSLVSESLYINRWNSFLTPLNASLTYSQTGPCSGSVLAYCGGDLHGFEEADPTVDEMESVYYLIDIDDALDMPVVKEWLRGIYMNVRMIATTTPESDVAVAAQVVRKVTKFDLLLVLDRARVPCYSIGWLDSVDWEQPLCAIDYASEPGRIWLLHNRMTSCDGVENHSKYAITEDGFDAVVREFGL